MLTPNQGWTLAQHQQSMIKGSINMESSEDFLLVWTKKAVYYYTKLFLFINQKI